MILAELPLIILLYNFFVFGLLPILATFLFSLCKFSTILQSLVSDGMYHIVNSTSAMYNISHRPWFIAKMTFYGLMDHTLSYRRLQLYQQGLISAACAVTWHMLFEDDNLLYSLGSGDARLYLAFVNWLLLPSSYKKA